jgi:hypothetical protein
MFSDVLQDKRSRFFHFFTTTPQKYFPYFQEMFPDRQDTFSARSPHVFVIFRMSTMFSGQSNLYEINFFTLIQ